MTAAPQRGTISRNRVAKEMREMTNRLIVLVAVIGLIVSVAGCAKPIEVRPGYDAPEYSAPGSAAPVGGVRNPGPK